MDLTVGGYFDATDTASGTITHIVGDGGLRPENLTINGTPITNPNPLSGALGSAWDNLTHTLPAGSVADTGVRTTLAFPSTSIDCLSWAAVVFSTDIQDTDNDAVPDRVEDGTAVVPAGVPALPDFPGMGANKTVPDLFVELGFFKTPGWGSGSPVGAHDHRPTAAALTMAGRAFKRAGITPHFDIGKDDLGDDRYPAPLSPGSPACSQLATWTLGCAIVPSARAKGGEFITETVCGSDPDAPCQFPDHPGTVGWKSGFAYFQQAPVADDGAELTAPAEVAKETACESTGACGFRRRFGANRMDFFHYSLWAHGPMH